MTEPIKRGSGKKKKHAKTLSRLLTPEYVEDDLRIVVSEDQSGTIDPFMREFMQKKKVAINKSKVTITALSFAAINFFLCAYKDEIAPLDKVVGEVFRGSKFHVEDDTQHYHIVYFGSNQEYKNIRLAKLVFPKHELSDGIAITFAKKRSNKDERIRYFQGGAWMENMTLHILLKGKNKPADSINGILIPLRRKRDLRTKETYKHQTSDVKRLMEDCIGHVYTTSQNPKKIIRNKSTGMSLYNTAGVHMTYHDGYFTTTSLINGVKELLKSYEK